VLLHNPEVQKSSDRTNLVDQLQQSFVALQQYVNQGKIATFGVVSNGFSLPEQHPLYLSWKDHVLAAVLKANNPAGSAGAAAGVKLGIVQLPVNLLETQGMVVAQEMHRHRIQKYADLLHSMQIYALRPMTCYPDRGTGTGHPFILADYKLPAKFATESLSSSEAGAAASELQWTHQMKAVPEVYRMALQVAMAHFDAEDILQAKAAGQALTMEQRETLDGCKLMQSLLFDVDQGLHHVRSFAAHEDFLLTQIIPLIHDTFESYDEDTAAVMQSFFQAYNLAVRYAIAQNVRKLLVKGDVDAAAAKSSTGKSNIKNTANLASAPLYPDLSPDMRLQEYALQYVCQQPALDKVIVGAAQPEEVVDSANIIRNLAAAKQAAMAAAAQEAAAAKEAATAAVAQEAATAAVAQEAKTAAVAQEAKTAAVATANNQEPTLETKEKTNGAPVA